MSLRSLLSSARKANDNPPFREILTASRNLYVNGVTGNDVNDGLSASSSGALKTIQAAIRLIEYTLDLSMLYDGYTEYVRVNVADGVYAEDIVMHSVYGQRHHRNMQIVGNRADVSEATIRTAKVHGGAWVLDGFTFDAGNGYSTLLEANGYDDGYARVVLGQAALKGSNNASKTGFGVYGTYGGKVMAVYDDTAGGNVDLSITGGFNRVALASYEGGTVDLSPATLNVTGTECNVFAFGAEEGRFKFYRDSLTGTATGKRYELTKGSRLFTSGGGAGGAEYLPGDVAGTADATSAYY